MRIKKFRNWNVETGAYDPVRDVVYLDGQLDDFPKMKRRVLVHELDHAKKPKDVWHHIKVDTKDMLLLCEYDCFEWLVRDKDRYNENEIAENDKYKRIYIIYNSFNMIRAFIQATTLPVSLVINLPYHIMKKKIEADKE